MGRIPATMVPGRWCSSAWRLARRFGAVVCLVAMTGYSVQAQQPSAPSLALPGDQKAPAKAANPQGAKPKPGQKQGFWYKLCDEQPQSKRQICFTFHEQVNVRTGRLYVSAALRKVSKTKTEHILVVVPPGVAVRPGLQIKIDDKEPIVLNYIICQPKGCTAEGEATTELVEQLKAGQNMMVAVIDVTGKINYLRVPLSGFKIAYKGPAVDKEIYFKAWRTQLDQLRRQQPRKAK